MKNKLQNNQGFNLLSLMITVVIVVILSTLAFVWINPLEQSGKAKDVQRTKAVNVLAAAFRDYSNNNKGALPFLGSVTTSSKKVLCQTQSGSNVTCDDSTEPCLRIADDYFYTNNLFELPIDPNKSSEQDTGYYVQKDSATGQLIVGACDSYGDAINKKTGLMVTCEAYAGGYCWIESDTAMRDCDNVCADNGLDCVSTASYGPDVDDEGLGFCALNKSWEGELRCGGGCVLDNGDGGVVSNQDGASSCRYRTDIIDCTARVSGQLNICPCE